MSHVAEKGGVLLSIWINADVVVPIGEVNVAT